MKVNSKIIFVALVAFCFILAGCSKEGNNMKDNNDMQNPIIVMETSKGTIEIELDAKNAPISTANFLSYVNESYYDGLIFHRIIPNFMIQGGGFFPNGTQKQTKPPIKLESRNGLSNTRGTIAMARTPVADSATSQFFINLVDNPFLNYAPGNDGYAVFGKVVVGMAVVDNIAKVKTGNFSGNKDWPVETVKIERMYVKK
jgi:cyclophilin family peptidyl-prolyl cis-trans isomerase